MNSINGVGNLGSLCNVSSCNNFVHVRPQAETSVPEQHDMVSLGQGAQEHEVAFPALVCNNDSTSQVAESFSQTASAKAPAPVAPNSVDAGNGLRATMSDLGVLTLLDDPAISSLNEVDAVSAADLASQQNTLALINLNSMESILANGLIPM